MRENLAKKGKVWYWNLTSKQEWPHQQVRDVLLVINANTSERAVTNTILLADRVNASISIVYTAKAPLMSDMKTSYEVDAEFEYLLRQGRKCLEEIERKAKIFGVKVSTNLVWSDSSEKLVKSFQKKADLVIDQSA